MYMYICICIYIYIYICIYIQRREQLLALRNMLGPDLPQVRCRGYLNEYQ